MVSIRSKEKKNYLVNWGIDGWGGGGVAIILNPGRSGEINIPEIQNFKKNIQGMRNVRLDLIYCRIIS